MNHGEPVKKAKKGLNLDKFIRPRKRLILLAAVLITVLLLALLAWWLQRNSSMSNNEQALIGLNKSYQDMKNNQKPGDSKPSQAAYYQQLASKASMAGEYEAAIDALKKRQAILGDSAPASEYIHLATYYCRLNDKGGALNTLAEASVLKQASQEDKNRIDTAIKQINKEGCTAWLLPIDQE